MKLVSIIIPNYNRANLIGETLESIQNQTYSNWECIIVDDGSTDNSERIINEYVAQDERFSLCKRPEDYPKGANACRNIGLTKLKGEYVVFFDSDDLMLENHLEVKVTALESSAYDFVVARTQNFYENDPNNRDVEMSGYHRNDNQLITIDNYITGRITWLTYDPVIKSSVVKDIRFTEKNKSAEEYSFFAKLVIETQNGKMITDFLTLRRMHEESHSATFDSKQKSLEKQFYYYWDTLNEVDNSKIGKEAIYFMIDNFLVALEKLGKSKLIFSKSKMFHWLMYRYSFFRGVYKFLKLGLI